MMGFNWLVQGWEVSDPFRISCCPIKVGYPVTLEILGSRGEAAVNIVLKENEALSRNWEAGLVCGRGEQALGCTLKN